MADLLERNLNEVQEHEDKRDPFAQLTPAYDILKAAKPYRSEDAGYYGLPLLKRPFWKWEIALYFFFEGVSAGSYVLCTVAGLKDQRRYRGLIRGGRALSFATMIVCPPLLIMDLGRPERFHHMLRIWKKTSPMNHGAWALSGYGAFSALLALLAIPSRSMPHEWWFDAWRFMQRWAPERLLSLLGLPFALVMVSYPGVLLSTTANPLWARTHFLGSLFASSSMSSGASALALLNYRTRDHGLHRILSRFEDAAALAESAALALYLGSARKAARPLWKGKQSKLFLLGAVGVGLLLPAVLRRSRNKWIRDAVAPLLTVAGSAALKWSVTYAGQESALDPEMARFTGETVEGKAYWGPKSPVDSEVLPRPAAVASM